MRHSILLCATVSLASILSVQCTPPTIRQTVNGPVEGVGMRTSIGQTFYAFKSIPYAKPPVTGIDPQTGETVDRRFKV